ncbi:hypothetical protein [Sphingobium sp. ZW T5_29]|uniref:hypothetical protein n=1 Tax=Sphingobium sp. ZW T5_29 TaxID=3378077 RepID=UPI003854564B
MELGEQVYRMVVERHNKVRERIIYIERRSGLAIAQRRAEVSRLEADLDVLEKAWRRLAREKPPLTLPQARMLLDELPGKF